MTAPDVPPTGPYSSPPPPGRPAVGVVVAVVVVGLLVVVLAVVGLVVLRDDGGTPDGASPGPSATPTSGTTPSEVPTSGPPATPSPSPTVTTPGGDVVIDAGSVDDLLVTAAELEATVPGASGGLAQAAGTEELPWGLPEGSTIEPAACTVARTVVASAPAGYAVRLWTGERVQVQQSVVLLPDPAAAQAAFRTLVTTVDQCPEYSQVNPGIDGSTWTAQPAIEGQGAYPGIHLELTQTAEGDSVTSFRGHTLVGNAIITWEATSLAADRDGALADLGEPEAIAELVEVTAQGAVAGLG